MKLRLAEGSRAARAACPAKLAVHRARVRADAVWTSFKYISLIMALLYLCFAAGHYLTLPSPERGIMTATALCSTVVLLALYFLLYRRCTPGAVAHPVAAMVMVVLLVNSGLHLYLSGDPAQTTNLLLIVIGAGIFFYSTLWLSVILALTTAVWLAAAIATGADGHWVHYAIFGIQGLLMAGLAHTLRIRALDRLLITELENASRSKELSATVEELARAEERMRQLSEASFEAIFLHQNGIIVDVNEQAVRLFGYHREQFNGMEMSTLLAPEARVQFPARRKTLHSFTGSTRDGHIHETIAIDRRGQRIPIEFGAVQRRPSPDQVDAVIVRDISDRRQLEHRLRDFVENAADYIYETDSRGFFTYVNGAIQRAAARAESLIGASCYEFVHPEVRDRIHREVLQHDFDSSPILYQEFRVNTGQERVERWIGQNVQPIISRGRTAGYRVVARDITDRVIAVRDVVLARQEADEANRGKSRFLSSMSHELRTPLNGILGFAQLLQEEVHGTLNERQKRYTASLTDCSAHLLTLIDDLLDLSKAEIGAIDLSPVPVTVEAMALSASGMFRRDAAEKTLHIAVEVDPEHRVLADPRRARQILINLLGNAVKYSPVSSTIRMASRRMGDEVEIIVQDRGPGVQTDHQERIFHEFFQSVQARDEDMGGSGIGLSLVRKLAHLHGGEVGYRDREGGGSEFWVRLPATDEEAVALESGFQPGQIQPGNTEARILVVDDMEANRFLLTEALVARGHVVEVAEDGAEALRRANDFCPALILMDMRMPTMDGFEATRRIKSEKQFKNTPIVALTASVNPDSVKRCLEAGCVEHLPKPVHLGTLFQCIDRHLGVENPAIHPSVPAGEATRGNGKARPLRILIAEDNATSRDFMGEFFSRRDDEAVFATNGREAVELALAGEFDLVLMDVVMPELNGLEATQEIRRTKSASDLPIVGLSGAEAGDDVDACRAVGMNDFLAKPVRFSRIVELLDNYRGER